MKIGDKISLLRSENNWSQSKLASYVGTNIKSVKDWENSVSEPTVKNIKKLCQLFHVTSDYLLGINETPTISLLGMKETDIRRIKAIIQAYLDTTTI